ncbi:hypothetical protein [Magnetospira thiophila]
MPEMSTTGPESCLVAMEACGGARPFAREIQASDMRSGVTR